MLPKLLKKRIRISLLTSILVFGPSVKAGRLIIPNDDDVLIRFGSSAIESAIPREEIKILIWNMYKGDKETWAQDYKKVTSDADILLLQEVISGPKMESVFAEDGRDYYLATSFIDTLKDDLRTGVAVASKFSPSSTSWQRSYFREPIIKTPKMTGVATFDLAGTEKDLLTLNIHAINFVTTRKLEHMVREATNLIKTHDGPVIFAGDFNTWSEKKLRMVHSVLKAVGMKPVGFRDDTRMRTFGNILDHVFIKDLKLKKSLVYGDIEGSDHKAMEVIVSY